MKLSELHVFDLEYVLDLAAKFEVDTDEIEMTTINGMVGQIWAKAIEGAGVEELDFSFNFNGLSSSLVFGGVEVSGFGDLVGMVYTVDIGVNGNDNDEVCIMVFNSKEEEVVFSTSVCIMVFNSKKEVVFSTSDLDISEDGLKAEMVLAGAGVEGRIVLRY